MPGRVTAWLVALLAVTVVTLVPDGAHGATAAVKLNAPKAKVKPTSLVTFSGSAGSARGSAVSVQRLVGKRWTTIAKGRTGSKGRFALTWITPSKAAGVSVRAVSGSRRPSTVRKLQVLKPAKGAKRIIVSPKARVISPSTVRSIPDPGKPGRITYAGGNDAQKGQILVVGKGDETPNGFIGRVTDVDSKNGQTVVSTVPATLQQAVPEGSMHLATSNVTAGGARATTAAARGKITCEGSVGASVTHDVSFTAGLTLDGSWTLLGGLQSASLTASAGVTASLKAALTAAGSCSLAKTTLLSVKGPSLSTFVGPIPVVMTSSLTVYLDATAAAQAELSTGASAGFDASAGISWTKANGFAPTQSFTPRFSFDPPSLSASASVAANVTPTIDVLLYGIVGPQIALRTGVEFAADPAADPWWALTVPVDLTAAISIKPLGLTSPSLHIYQRSFTIADAGGPFGSTPPAQGGVTNVATPATSLAAGFDFSCGLRPSGAVACWGADGKGQLGNGAAGASANPVAVTGITDAAGIVAGNQHACALRIRGQVACWGDNAQAQLGNGATGGTSTTPVAVSNMTSATAVAAGSQHSCALLASRRVACWGINAQHQLGDGGTTPSSVPVEVSGINNATSIASGYSHSCAVRAGGTVACWGRNGDGRLGNGSTAESAVPVAVSGITNATGVATGSNHACALLGTGGVSCWGDNFYGQLGNGSAPADSTVPVPVSGITNATAIEAGAAHTCARLATGAVKCWGWNEFGALGDGTDSDRSSPVSVNGITDATAVTGGLEHTCALRSSGAMACWGFGVDGELGNGGNATSFNPVGVVGFP